MRALFDNANTSSAWEDPIAHVDETPHDEVNDDFRSENPDDKRGYFRIWLGGIKEIVDCERYVSPGSDMIGVNPRTPDALHVMNQVYQAEIESHDYDAED